MSSVFLRYLTTCISAYAFVHVLIYSPTDRPTDDGYHFITNNPPAVLTTRLESRPHLHHHSSFYTTPPSSSFSPSLPHPHPSPHPPPFSFTLFPHHSPSCTPTLHLLTSHPHHSDFQELVYVFLKSV